MLVAAGLGCLLLAIELLTAAAGQPVSPWGHLPRSSSHAGSAAVALAVMVALVALLALVFRRRPRALTVPVEDGTVVVAADALSELVTAAIAADPDVLRVTAEIDQTGEDALVADVRVVLRPLADEKVLGGALRERARDVLERAGGWAVDVRRFDARSVTVHDLARYL